MEVKRKSSNLVMYREVRPGQVFCWSGCEYLRSAGGHARLSDGATGRFINDETLVSVVNGSFVED